jgi:putative Holliday junction resolvase
VRILGLDYGAARIGVALCDELEIAAHALPNVECDGEELDRIAELCAEHEVALVVLGLPLQMDGSEGNAARKVRSFAKDLRRCLRGMELQFMDERLTSAQAHSALSLMGAGSRRRRQAVDGMAAQLILQRFLDRRAAARRDAEGTGVGESDGSDV